VSNSKNIKFIQLRYTDVPGRFLAKYIAKHKEEEIYKYGIGFDGSSVIWPLGNGNIVSILRLYSTVKAKVFATILKNSDIWKSSEAI
jgi:glutamine synthetase